MEEVEEEEKEAGADLGVGQLLLVLELGEERGGAAGLQELLHRHLGGGEVEVEQEEEEGEVEVVEQ